MAPASGFILQPTYRILSGQPVVLLYGRLNSGETFLVRDNRMRPYFFVEAQDEVRVRELGARNLTAGEWQTLAGEPALRVELEIPADAPRLRDRIHEAGLPTYQADVRFAMNYLIERGIRGAIEIEGKARKGKRVDRVYDNPEVRPARDTAVPGLRVLSIDIETDPNIRHILSIALYGCGASEVLLLTPKSRTCPRSATPAVDEKQLLRLFCERVRKHDPDVIVGWNVADFDFDVLIRRAEDLAVPFEMGRTSGRTRLRRGQGWRQATQVLIPGRIVLDGPQTLRSSFITMERMSLDFVSRQVLGEGKSIGESDQTGSGRAETILRWFQDARERFVEYNLRDARLALEVFEKLRLLELSIERSRLTGMPIDRVSASVASFDFLYLSELHRRGIVAPSVGSPTRSTRMRPMAGGHLLEPMVGLHENVLLLDFKSLYPSLIRTFQIDPLGHVRAPEANAATRAPIVAPNGARFSREPGILPGLLDELMPRREAAKKAGNAPASQAIKILMNSFYGVLGTSSCRFFDPDIANAITGFGKEMLVWCKRRLEEKGYPVLYGDTDSLFVASGVSRDEASEAAPALGQSLAEELTRELATYIEERWQTESRLELEFERLYLKLFLPPVRSGKEGAMKRYAGLVPGKDGPVVTFTGLEAVRRDWTDFAREAQRGLYQRLFLERPIEDYLIRLVTELRGGRLDDSLVYRKAMRKQESDYTSTTPPHVAAARKMSRPPGPLIEYVMTVAGPEPAEERENDYDYEHYLEKQLMPIAEPVLQLLELDFRRVIGDDKQLDLF